MKKRKIILLLIIILILVLLASVYGINIIRKSKTDKLAEEKYNFEYELYDNTEEQNKVLVKVSNIDGINSITCPDNNIIYCNGKTYFAMDYEVTENTENNFIVNYMDGENRQYTLIIDDNAKNNVLNIRDNVINEGKANVALDINIEAYHFNKIYYKIGDNETNWTEYTNALNYSSQYIYEKQYNDDNIINIYAKKTDAKGNTVIVNKKVNIPEIVRNNIIEYIIQNDIEDGIQEYTIGEVTYKFEVVNFNEDVTYTTTPILGNDTSDDAMLILKYHGNLTLNSGVTIMPQVPKKGMYICVLGDLINNGTISMSQKGSIANGEEIYLWQEKTKNVYDNILAVGANGGARANSGLASSVRGNDGGNGTGRQTGGGASGAARQRYGSGFSSGPTYSGAGGNGTSYCGGAGGSGADYNKGGYGANATVNGGGGLLIIYSNNIINDGTISSNGGPGTSEGTVGSGGTGGGSVNIFYKNSYSGNDAIATGGIGGTGTIKNGGNGGNGTVTLTQI